MTKKIEIKKKLHDSQKILSTHNVGNQKDVNFVSNSDSMETQSSFFNHIVE